MEAFRSLTIANCSGRRLWGPVQFLRAYDGHLRLRQTAKNRHLVTENDKKWTASRDCESHQSI